MPEKWIRKFREPVGKINCLLREAINEDGVIPEIYVVQDAKHLGEDVQVIEITISPNPHYSEWTKLHIDFCRRFPKASFWQKLYFPSVVAFKGSIRRWWWDNIESKWIFR